MDATNALVSRGGFSFNRRTNSLLQTIAVKNVGGDPVPGPVYVALDNLSANTSLLNGTGLAANQPPAGSPYILVSSADLAPGAAASVTLQFANPATGTVTYAARTLTGTANP